MSHPIITQVGNVNFCISCGTELEPNWKLCPNCGKAINPTELPPQIDTPNVMHERACSNCGKPVSKDQVICMNCGIQLKKVKSKSFINSIAKCYCFMVIAAIIITVILILLPSFYI